MRRPRPDARTRTASGRFILALVVILASCGPHGAPRAGEAPSAAGEPPIESGTPSAAAEAASARLLREAEDASRTKQWRAALNASSAVIRQYPQTPGSSKALRLGARAALELQEPGLADSLAARYLEVLPEGRGRRIPTILVRGRAQLALGRSKDGVRTLLSLPADADPAARTAALSEIRTAVDGMDTPALSELASDPSLGGPLLAPVLTELAVARHFEGREEEAQAYARRASGLAEEGPERRMATAVLEGRIEDVLGAPPALGALVPGEGSPGLRRVAGLIEDGVRLATDEAESRSRRPVELHVLEDTGAPDQAVARYRELEAADPAGIVGPLLDGELEAVAAARRRLIPLLSPTAQNPPSDLAAVYSLNGPDPGQARVLAQYARRAGFDTAAVVHSTVRTSVLEARAFAQAFRAAGGTIVAELPYDSGATYFQDQFLKVAELRPEAIVLPVPARDLELLAPQVSFFGLDTLNIRVLGTSGWTSEAALNAVETRHTDSVVAVAARAPGRADSTWLAFVQAYESRYKRSLRSPVPALGYDAAGLLLEAIRRGGRTPADLRRALESIRGYRGATGVISVEDGQVVREWFPVLIHQRRLEPIDPTGPPPIGPLPPPPPPPDTTEAGNGVRPDTSRIPEALLTRQRPPGPAQVHAGGAAARSEEGRAHPARRRIRLRPRG